MVNEGYAAVFREREIIIETVSPTALAAMVNWLIVGAGIMVEKGAGDFTIRDLFDRYAPGEHVTIECVALRVVRGAKP